VFQRSLRWRVGVGYSFLLAAAGVLFVESVLLVAAMVPMAFVAYSAVTSAPTVGPSLAVTRTVAPKRPAPGQPVDVRLTVENDGEQPISELRLADGVPDQLSVIDGSPRAAVGLQSGESVSIEYRLRSRYGNHEFGDVTVRTHSLSAGSVYTTTVTPSGDASLSATLAPGKRPQTQGGSGTTGGLLLNQANEGLEFFGIKTYQPTDPIHKVNWRRYAKDRELTTIDYREREVSDVLVIVDARRCAAVARDRTAPTGTELCAYVANEIVNSVGNHQSPIGVAALGVDQFDDNDGLAWVLPGTDSEGATQHRALLDTAAATVHSETGSPVSAVSDEAFLTLIRQLRSGTHVVFISPFQDDRSVEFVRQLRSTGHEVSACAPDVTTTATAGGQIEATRHRIHLAELRQLDVGVVDWQPDDPLEESLRRALQMTRTTLKGR
jgi:uncharacterized protein (DUF58 family)